MVTYKFADFSETLVLFVERIAHSCKKQKQEVTSSSMVEVSKVLLRPVIVNTIRSFDVPSAFSVYRNMYAQNKIRIRPIQQSGKYSFTINLDMHTCGRKCATNDF